MKYENIFLVIINVVRSSVAERLSRVKFRYVDGQLSCRMAHRWAMATAPVRFRPNRQIAKTLRVKKCFLLCCTAGIEQEGGRN